MKKIIFIVLLFTIKSNNLFSQVLLDNQFGIGGKVVNSLSQNNDVIYDMALQADSKIIACGISRIGNMYYMTLSRYNTDGSLDVNFGTNGIIITNFGTNSFNINSLEIQNDGKILLAGTAINGTLDYNYLFTVIRYTIDGALDTTFGTNGIVTTDFSNGGGGTSGVDDIVIQNDNKIVIVGRTRWSPTIIDPDFAVIRLNHDGSLDSNFGDNGKAHFNIGTYLFTGNTSDDRVNHVKLQSDGKILIIGQTNANTTTANTNRNLGLIRVNTNGTLDTSFGTNGIVIYDFGGDDIDFHIDTTPDNKILIGGNTYFNSASNSKMSFAKLNYDGSFDTTFGTNGISLIQLNNSIMQDYIGDFKVQPDGKILVGGYSVNTIYPDFLLLKLTSTGFIDTSFNSTGYVTTDFNNDVDVPHSLLIQNDGKIVLGGATGADTNTNYEHALARYVVSNLSNTQFELQKMKLYPNPVSSFLKYSLNLENPINTIIVLNPFGQIVATYENPLTDEIDVSNLESGNYFIQFHMEKGTEIVKIIKI